MPLLERGIIVGAETEDVALTAVWCRRQLPLSNPSSFGITAVTRSLDDLTASGIDIACAHTRLHRVNCRLKGLNNGLRDLLNFRIRGSQNNPTHKGLDKRRQHAPSSIRTVSPRVTARFPKVVWATPDRHRTSRSDPPPGSPIHQPPSPCAAGALSRPGWNPPA